MYLYIYDIFLNNKKYNQILANIEGRLNDLDIKGKICRLNLLKNLKEIIDEAVKHGTKTIVAVGDDNTFSKIINYTINYEIVVGFIPMIKNSKIANILGVLPFEKACDIIAQRIIKKIDIGKINTYYFIDTAKISNAKIKIKFKNFEITPLNNNYIFFCNLGLSNNQNFYCNPTDGFLEAIITPYQKNLIFKTKKIEKQSIFPFTKIKVISLNENESASILVDDQFNVKTPAEIEVLHGKLKIIVGGNRLFD